MSIKIEWVKFDITKTPSEAKPNGEIQVEVNDNILSKYQTQTTYRIHKMLFEDKWYYYGSEEDRDALIKLIILNN